MDKTILKTQKIINLNGKMSILGVSKINEEVWKGMTIASNSFYIMEELVQEAEKIISNKFNVENCFITSSATAAIMHIVASLKKKLKLKGINRSPNIALPLGHHIDYGAKIHEIIEFSGGNIVPIGSSNLLRIKDLEIANTNNDIDLAIFISSHHSIQKNHISYLEFVNYFKSLNIKTAIDIAAEVDIWKFVKSKVDFLIVSGSKAIEAPSSGFILTSHKNKKMIILNKNGIDRIAKLSKENIIGLIYAINHYSKTREISFVEKNIQKYVEQIKKIVSFEITITEDARMIKRIKLIAQNNIQAKLFHNYLIQNHIFPRSFYINFQTIELDLRQVSKKEMEQVMTKIKEYKW